MPIKVEGLAPLIHVFDMPTSVAFYRDVLGFEVVMQSQPGDAFDWGLLRRDGAEVMLNTTRRSAGRPPRILLASPRTRTPRSTLAAEMWTRHSRICGQKGST